MFASSTDFHLYQLEEEFFVECKFLALSEPT